MLLSLCLNNGLELKTQEGAWNKRSPQFPPQLFLFYNLNFISVRIKEVGSESSLFAAEKIKPQGGRNLGIPGAQQRFRRSKNEQSKTRGAVPGEESHHPNANQESKRDLSLGHFLQPLWR